MNDLLNWQTQASTETNVFYTHDDTYTRKGNEL